MFALPLVGWTMLSAGGLLSPWSAAFISPNLSASIQRCSR
jgi:hypothetical protein